MSILFSWRNRPKSAMFGEDNFAHFGDLSLGSGRDAASADRRASHMSVDELRFATTRSGFRGRQSMSGLPAHWGVLNDSIYSDGQPGQPGRTEEASLATAAPHNQPAAHSSSSHGKKAIKGIIRRASVSLHGFMSRRPSFSTPDKAPVDESVAAPTPLSSSHPWSGRLAVPTQPPSTTHAPAAQQSTSASTQPAADPRPNASHVFPGWRRLRQAASFRHSRVFDSDVHLGLPNGLGPAQGHMFYDHPHGSQQQPSLSLPHPLEAMPSPREMMFFSLSSHSPASDPLSALSTNDIPLSPTGPLNLGVGPPVIPLNTGGAARAAAAAAFQSDMLQMQQQQGQDEQQEHQQHQHQQQQWPHHPDEYGNDRESGIGIAVTATDPDVIDGAKSSADGSTLYLLNASMDSGMLLDDGGQAPISKVDFIVQLPVELSIMVLSHLDAAGLAAASRVSRQWHRVLQNQHIWRESFLHEKTTTYATSAPVRPGVGQGIPAVQPSCDWRQIYRVKQELDRRWKQGKTRPVYLNGHSDSIYCLQFDETKIITGSRDRTIRIWDMHTLECRLVIGPPSVVHDSKLLIDEHGQPAHYVTTAYHTRSSCSMPAAVSFPMHHSASILCLQYDDRMLVTGSSDSSCIVYSVKSGYRPVRRLRHHAAAVLDLCFDDRHIVTCSKDISICVWDRETGAMLKQLRGHSGPVNAVQMRGNTIVSCSGDFRVKLWNIETGRAIRELTGHTKGLACSQFSEDGRFVASAGNDRVIRIWDANTGECVGAMKAHENLVRSLHIDSVSGRLVSGSYDRDIKVFDMATGQQLLDFPQWHQSWVLSAKSDYRRIVSTGQDPKVLIMDFGAGIDGIEMLETANPDGVMGGGSEADPMATSSTTGHGAEPQHPAGYI
ncbi:f-box and wd domain containing protein [Grosmannia clavigera kw1407]|uniref:F-box and wd domain containing protein n=1 Tax=Grosmannia clavigera (strain kw1407 / UAMH 11150) TaxID=655863 RepID=F0XPI0_GROCL|nr:f-box and wd domain containing protein [Grosmannia clavigera kw1407]EFX00316.1 f-box and wd domain containing protein [Grosmannia clavigera kw1407]